MYSGHTAAVTGVAARDPLLYTASWDKTVRCCAYTHAHAHAHARTHTHAHAHARTHTHARTRTHAHANTHLNPPSLPFPAP